MCETGVCVQVRNARFEDQKKPFSWGLAKGLAFLKRVQNHFKMLLEMSCPGKYCSNREKCEALVGFVSTPRSLYGSGKCGAWVHEHVKTTKTDETRSPLLKKTNLLPDIQLFIIVPFQSTKHRKREWWVDNEVKETIGDVFCPTSRNEKRVYSSNKKASGF